MRVQLKQCQPGFQLLCSQHCSVSDAQLGNVRRYVRQEVSSAEEGTHGQRCHAGKRTGTASPALSTQGRCPSSSPNTWSVRTATHNPISACADDSLCGDINTRHISNATGKRWRLRSRQIHLYACTRASSNVDDEVENPPCYAPSWCCRLRQLAMKQREGTDGARARNQCTKPINMSCRGAPRPTSG